MVEPVHLPCPKTWRNTIWGGGRGLRKRRREDGEVDPDDEIKQNDFDKSVS